MKKRLISMLLALLAVMGLLPTAAFAASTPEEALGEVQIYNGGVEMCIRDRSSVSHSGLENC